MTDPIYGILVEFTKTCCYRTKRDIVTGTPSFDLTARLISLFRLKEIQLLFGSKVLMTGVNSVTISVLITSLRIVFTIIILFSLFMYLHILPSFYHHLFMFVVVILMVFWVSVTLILLHLFNLFLFLFPFSFYRSKRESLA